MLPKKSIRWLKMGAEGSNSVYTPPSPPKSESGALIDLRARPPQVKIKLSIPLTDVEVLTCMILLRTGKFKLPTTRRKVSLRTCTVTGPIRPVVAASQVAINVLGRNKDEKMWERRDQNQYIHIHPSSSSIKMRAEGFLLWKKRWENLGAEGSKSVYTPPPSPPK